MAIVDGRTYRFTNVYHEGYGLNIYGTSANDIKGGQNVCLYPASASDKMQQWKTEERDDKTYRLHTVMTGRTNYVLDCSDGSISTSYKNNAHMCLETGTTDVDCAVEFEYVGTNRVRIHLGQKGLCLTATTVADNDAELSNNISTSAALRGGSAGRGNVYWASPASEGSMTWKKQCWYVIDVEGGSEPEPDPGDDTLTSDVVVSMPDDTYLSQRESSTWTGFDYSICSLQTLKDSGCSAVAATMMARIMENDNSITPKDLYDWGVWTVRGNAPWANWTQNNYSQLHFTFEESATKGWSTAKGLIFDEIMEDRPVIIWLTNNSGGTHFVVAYGLKRGASRENLQYNQIMVLNPYPMPNNGIYEDGTLDEVMQLALWSKFGSIRRAIV